MGRKNVVTKNESRGLNRSRMEKKTLQTSEYILQGLNEFFLFEYLGLNLTVQVYPLSVLYSVM